MVRFPLLVCVRFNFQFSTLDVWKQVRVGFKTSGLQFLEGLRVTLRCNR